MSVIAVLMGLSLSLGLLFLGLFLWNLNKGQFSDDYTPSLRILFDDAPEKANEIQNPPLPTSTKN